MENGTKAILWVSAVAMFVALLAHSTLAGLIVIAPSPRLPAASLPLAALSQDGATTPEQIALILPVTGPLNQGTTATVRYKQSADITYTTGHPLFRVRPSFSTVPGAGTVEDVFAWTLIDLTPGTSYDVEVTVNDGSTQEVKTLTTSTRAMPGACGAPNKTANTAANILTQVAGLVAGDVLEILDGNYTLTAEIDLNSNGTSGSPICIRGQSRTGVVITYTGGRIFRLQESDYVTIENMTIVGSQTDDPAEIPPGNNGAASVAFEQTNNAYNTVNVTIRNITANGVDRFVDFLGPVTGALVYDNTATGNNLWSTAGNNFLGTNITWNDAGIKLPGNGNAAFNNTLTGFGDTFSYASSDTILGTNIHYYRNEIRNSTDDPLEVDDGKRNLTWYDNRIHNSINVESLDPLFGGPFISVRNIVINPYRVNTHKWNDQNSGQFLYNNTIIATASVGTDADVANWYQPNNGPQEAWGYQNNLHVYRGTGQSVWIENGGHTTLDFSNNAWYPDRAIDWGSFFTNLAAAQAGFGATTPVFSGKQRFEDDVITVTNPWTQTITLGGNSNTEVTGTYLPILAAGDNAKNAGVAIPNVTDGYAGVAPDIGAVIEGRASVSYGDRSAVPAYISALTDYEVLQISTTISGNTAMDDVTPSEWLTNDPATLGLRGVIDAWSGGGKAISGTKLYLNGGGHNDSANNGLYIFDFAGTTAPNGFETPLVSDVADATAEANAYADGLPTAVHSYDGLVYAHHNDTLYRFGGIRYGAPGNATAGVWRYRNGAWTALSNYPENPQFLVTVYDPSSGNIFAINQGDFDGRFFRTSAETFSAAKSLASVITYSDASAAWDPSRGRAVVVGSSTDKVLTLDFGAETASIANLSATGDTTILGEGGVSLFYDAARDVFWLFGGNDTSVGLSTIYEMNAGTFAITAHSLSASIGAGISADNQGTFGRFVFLSDYRAIGIVTVEDAGPWIIKLPET